MTTSWEREYIPQIKLKEIIRSQNMSYFDDSTDYDHARQQVANIARLREYERARTTQRAPPPRTVRADSVQEMYYGAGSRETEHERLAELVAEKMMQKMSKKSMPTFEKKRERIAITSIPLYQWQHWQKDFHIPGEYTRVMIENITKTYAKEFPYEAIRKIQDLQSGISMLVYHMRTGNIANVIYLDEITSQFFTQLGKCDFITQMKNYKLPIGRIIPFSNGIIEQELPLPCQPASPPPERKQLSDDSTIPSAQPATSSPSLPTITSLEPQKFRGCLICQERDNNSCFTPCTHAFCSKCAKSMKEKNKRCPVCNMKIKSIFKFIIPGEQTAASQSDA